MDNPQVDDVSLEEPDWAREAPRRFWDPGRKLLKSIRSYQRAAGPLAGFKRGLAVLRHRFWSVVCGCDIPINADIGGGLMIPHPVGIVVHQQAKIGINCLLMQNTTLGVAGGTGEAGAPQMAAGCDVSAGAVLVGPIKLGERVLVGANAVVTKDVPDRAVVVGVPAKQIGER